jgi:hypothetical protein
MAALRPRNLLMTGSLPVVAQDVDCVKLGLASKRVPRERRQQADATMEAAQKTRIETIPLVETDNWAW